MEELSDDQRIRKELMNTNEAGMGANDPNVIDFIGHQNNFENVV